VSDGQVDGEINGVRGMRWWLPVALGILVVLSATRFVLRLRERSHVVCEQEQQDTASRHNIPVGQAEGPPCEDVRDPLAAANCFLRRGDLAGAERSASAMIGGSRYGSAHWILGYVAMRKVSSTEAKVHAIVALVAHTLTRDDQELIRDLVLLSEIAKQIGDFERALDLADDVLRLLLRSESRDSHAWMLAYVARADALRRLGDLQSASNTLASALEPGASVCEACDRMWLHLKRGLTLVEQGSPWAMSELWIAEEANIRCKQRDVTMQILMNRAWLRRRDDPVGASADLDRLAKLDEPDEPAFEEYLLRGYLAADRGQCDEAERDFDKAERQAPSDADWLWVLERARGELSEMCGSLNAESHYRRSAEMVTSLRANARFHSGNFVSSHRAAYDDLIGLLARQGRWRDVMTVVLGLDASDMLRATTDGVAPHGGDDLPRAASPPPNVVAPIAVNDLLSAWQSRDLVVVIAPTPREIGPGTEQVYRLRISHGEVTGQVVGSAIHARTMAEALLTDPGDRVAAQQLGAMIVPPGADGDVLHVLAIGALSKVPLAALRDADGALSLAKRPFVRVLALHAKKPIRSASLGGEHAVVIADPLWNLPSAAIEGIVVAGMLGAGTERYGRWADRPATRARLESARDALVLHVAAHVGDYGLSRALFLFDGTVTPSEIVANHIAPHIAVLASCGSAAATDEEGWGSHAAAFLAAGTSAVVATDRSVGDEVALIVMTAFYAQPDWRTDPARALARVQQDLATGDRSNPEASKPAVWAAFFVLARPPEIEHR